MSHVCTHTVTYCHILPHTITYTHIVTYTHTPWHTSTLWHTLTLWYTPTLCDIHLHSDIHPRYFTYTLISCESRLAKQVCRKFLLKFWIEHYICIFLISQYIWEAANVYRTKADLYLNLSELVSDWEEHVLPQTWVTSRYDIMGINYCIPYYSLFLYSSNNWNVIRGI